MPILFNTILRASGLSLADIRLLRHKDPRAAKGRTPYELWRDHRPEFDLYQAVQALRNEGKLRAPYWASFVGTPADETLFIGLYSNRGAKLLDKDIPKPHMDGVDRAGTCHVYDLALLEPLSDLRGRLVVDWGSGDRAWVQRADNQDKPVVELRTKFEEPSFPGFLNFIEPLSKLPKLPPTWITTLQSSQGVYLLTCPKTKEQYVGSATGELGFWGRWQSYLDGGDGGNEGLKSRDPSDYQVSILEVAGSASQPEDVTAMEGLWQRKLQSREMGLNRNLAKASSD